MHMGDMATMLHYTVQNHTDSYIVKLLVTFSYLD